MSQNPRPSHVPISGTSFPELVESLVASYGSDNRAQRINRHFLPSQSGIIEVLELQLHLLYPGYYGREDLTDENVAYHVGVTLTTLEEKLAAQVERCLCFGAEAKGQTNLPVCHSRSKEIARTFLSRLPILRAMVIEDLQAAFDGDPAAESLDEIVLSYPGLLAVTVYRVAHELHLLGVPIMPRIMTEWAHARTGADIHPGAKIGRRFFVDHATGVVIGSTSEIGSDVKLYQGVTLGALSIAKDADGRVVRGSKRHPTVQDGVTIYANATVLGGGTTVGSHSVIGGSVFVTKSVPPQSRVALRPHDLQMMPIVRGEIEFEI